MIAAIITAAGRGTRLQSNISKQFIQINGKPVLVHTLQSFQDAFRINEVYLVVPGDYEEYCREEIVKKYRFTKVKEIIVGGQIRQDSVFNALNAIPKRCKIVAVHDGVRPLITADEINMLIENLVRLNKQDPQLKGVLIGAPAYETIKKINEDHFIDSTIKRSQVCMAQTPQVFYFKDLVFAYKKAYLDKFFGNDDAGLMERAGFKVKVILGRHENIKITTPLDLFLAELIMRRDGKGYNEKRGKGVIIKRDVKRVIMKRDLKGEIG